MCDVLDSADHSVLVNHISKQLMFYDENLEGRAHCPTDDLVHACG